MSEDDNIYLVEKEFRELEAKAQWNYIEHLMKMLGGLKIRADKNCEECEKIMVSPHDLNIDMLFEDWRWCKDKCDDCGKEEQVFMCDLMFQITSHIANELNSLRTRQNAMTKLVFKRDVKGSELLKTIEQRQKTEKEQSKRSGDLYL